MDIDCFVTRTNRRLEELERRAASMREESTITAKIDASDVAQMCQEFSDLIKGAQESIAEFAQQTSAQVSAVEGRLAAIEERITALENGDD